MGCVFSRQLIKEPTVVRHVKEVDADIPNPVPLRTLA
jgi:hypothetical protein